MSKDAVSVGSAPMGKSSDPETSPWTRFVQRLPRKRWIGFFVSVVLLLFLLSSTHVRVAIKSAAFLIEIFPEMPVYPQRWFQDEPTRSRVLIPYEDGVFPAWVYRPAGDKCTAGMVLYIGMGPEHDDPHLDRAARAFARNGITVMIPVSEAMVDYMIVAGEHEYAVSTFQLLQNDPAVDRDRIGMFGVSVGGSVVVNAAQDSRINHDVRMVHSLGGYYDASELLGSMAVGAFHVDDEWIGWEPSATTIRVIRDSILEIMPDDDYVPLWYLFTDGGDVVPDGLTSGGEALARLLINDTPDAIPALIDDLPPDLQAYMAQISPSHRIDSLYAETLLLHDVHDHVLPYSESVRFYNELETAESKRLTLLRVFHHVRPDEEGDRWTLVGDGLRLFRHVFHLHSSLDDRGVFVDVREIIPGLWSDQPCDA